MINAIFKCTSFRIDTILKYQSRRYLGGLFLFLILGTQFVGLAQKNCKVSSIISGVPWFDQHGKVVSAHGANIIKDNDRYYFFGECHTDTSNAFNGFSCYSSADLRNWKFERMVLPLQKNGKLGPNRVGERPKVLKCPHTGEYILYMHADSITYKDQYVGYATSDKINGTYTFRGPLLFNGKPIRKWDMGVFQDTDGSGYIITHSGNLYRLSDDYKSVTEQLVKDMTPQCEAPAIFRKDSVYFWLGSYLSSWEKNDNYYFTARSLRGPWVPRGNFAPVGSLTLNSQTTFVLPVSGTEGTTYLFMGDRWSYPKQASAATYIWQPLRVEAGSISLPVYEQSWNVDLKTGFWSALPVTGKPIGLSALTRTGLWSDIIIENQTFLRSQQRGAALSYRFQGRQVSLLGRSTPDGGYVRVSIKNRQGKVVLSSLVDFYCKYPVSELKFVSPKLPTDDYLFNMEIQGEHGNWTDKRKNIYGSTGDYMTISGLIVE